MTLQISSGYGPAECEMAVGKFVDALCEEFDGITIKSTCLGADKGCFKSILIECEQDLTFLEGSVKWICKSPFRPNHKRKNWFIDVSVVETHKNTKLDGDFIRFDTFRSGGKGGQHVNKVETGVRATYIPLGISAVSTDGRSQHMNKKLALERLSDMIARQDNTSKLAVQHLNRLEHARLQRGNAARVYEGLQFRRVMSANGQ
jgi:peptide chain release factor